MKWKWEVCSYILLVSLLGRLLGVVGRPTKSKHPPRKTLNPIFVLTPSITQTCNVKRACQCCAQARKREASHNCRDVGVEADLKGL